MRIGGNHYDLREVSGAFGDLGTLVPFVVGYLAITGLDPVGILVSTGLFQVAAGLYFRTPVPVQPMKAIGTQAIAHAATITPGAIWASGLFTGVVWLVLGLTGAIAWVAGVIRAPSHRRCRHVEHGRRLSRRPRPLAPLPSWLATRVTIGS